jgi:cytochrome P450
LIAAGVFNPRWLGLPINNTNRTIISQNRQLQAFTAKIIDDKIKKIRVEVEEGVEATDRSESDDLVDVVVRTNFEVEKRDMEKHGKATVMSAKELQGQIQVLLFAGYETSSVTTVSIVSIMQR